MWNRKPKFDEQEQEIIDLIELLANHKETKVEVELDDLTLYLDNKELHYSAIIDGKGIKITNSSFSVHKHFRDNVLAVSKSFAQKRITEEVQKTKDSIDAREKAMFNKMQESLTNYGKTNQIYKYR